MEYVKKQKVKIKKLETELSTFKEKGAETPITSPVGSIADAAQALKLENEHYEKQLAAKEAEIVALSKSIEDGEDEKIKLVSQKNSEIAACNKTIDELKAQIDHNSTSYLEQIQLLNVQLAEQCKECDQLKALNEGLASSANRNSDSSATNKLELDRLNQVISEWVEKDATHAAKSSSLEARVLALQGELQEQTAKLAAELDAHNSNISQWTLRFEASQSELIAQRTECESLARKNTSLVEELTAANAGLKEKVLALDLACGKQEAAERKYLELQSKQSVPVVSNGNTNVVLPAQPPTQGMWF